MRAGIYIENIMDNEGQRAREGRQIKLWLPPLHKAQDLYMNVYNAWCDLEPSQHLAIVTAEVPLILPNGAATIGQWLRPNTARFVDQSERQNTA